MCERCGFEGVRVVLGRVVGVGWGGVGWGWVGWGRVVVRWFRGGFAGDSRGL